MSINAAPLPGDLGSLNSEGLVARISPIRHVTPAVVLSRPIWLPAILNNFLVTETALHNEYDTLSAGQFSQPAMGPPTATQLRDLPVDSLTLAYDPPWIVVSGQNPIRLRNALFGVLRARKPVHLLVTFNPNPGPWPEIDMNVTLRSASREIRAGEHDTRYISIDFKEWRDPQTREFSSRPRGGRSSRAPGVHLPTTERLAATDTLSSLSFRYYGTYEFWRTIRDANGIPHRFGSKTPLVHLGGRFKVGTKIKIPEPPHVGSNRSNG